MRKLPLFLALFFAFCDISKAKNSTLLYNGNNKVFLALKKPFKVEILEDGIVKAKFDLPKAEDATVSGTSSGANFGLDIKYSKQIQSPNGTLDDVTLSFAIHFNKSTGYWTLKSLKASYSGSLKGGASINIANDPLDVDSRPGVTTLSADRLCARGYTTCAPKHLCWACDDQVFKAKNSPKISHRLTMPGVKLQPVLSNGTKANFKFGYEWNCDPVIPLGVWVGLLLTVVLLSFLYWATDMLVNLQTPNKFDDPRGKPLQVPTSD